MRRTIISVFPFIFQKLCTVLPNNRKFICQWKINLKLFEKKGCNNTVVLEGFNSRVFSNKTVVVQCKLLLLKQVELPLVRLKTRATIQPCLLLHPILQ